MSTYVIAHKSRHEEPSPPPVLSDPHQTMIPAIFTDHRAAARYLDRLGSDYEIARLNAMQLLRWMVRVYEQGTHYLFVNPPTASFEGETIESRLAIEQQLARFAELLTRDVVACAETGKRDRQYTG